AGPVIGTPDAWRQRADMIMEKGLQTMAPDLVPRWFGPKICNEQPALVPGWCVQLGRTDNRSYALLCLMLGRCNYSEAFSNVPVPLQIIAGSDDIATPPASLQALAKALGAAEPVVLEGVGHVPAVESPAKMVELLKQVIRKFEVCFSPTKYRAHSPVFMQISQLSSSSKLILIGSLPKCFR